MQLNCRICFEEDIRTNLISPCLCSGNMKYVHTQCLNNWRNIPSPNNEKFYSCEICKEKFILEYNKEKTKLNFKYKMYIGFEILIIILIIVFACYLAGKLINLSLSNPIIITRVNSQLINEIIVGLAVIMFIFFVIGCVAIMQTNNRGIINYDGTYIRDPLRILSMKVVFSIIAIIGLLIIIYWLINFIINVRKEYFYIRQITNTNDLIVKDREKLFL